MTQVSACMHAEFLHVLIRECGSVLYLGMPRKFHIYHTDALAGKRPKELQPPKPSMQTELHCLAVHINTRKRTLGYAGVEKQVAEKF